MSTVAKPPDLTVPEAAIQRSMFAAGRKLVALLGSLTPIVADLHDKYAVAHSTWLQAIHAEAIRQRMWEMRGGGRREPAIEAGLDAVFEAALRAPSPAGIVLGIHAVLKADLARVYKQYLERAHPLGDRPSLLLFSSFLEQEEEAIERGVEIAGHMGTGGAEDDWVRYLKARLEAAGGIDGSLHGTTPAEAEPPESRPFTLPAHPDWGAHPVRFTFGTEGPDGDLIPYCFQNQEADLRIVRAGMYTWLFHESDVLDYLPPMFHATQDMPFDFTLDLARHFWDEARHSEAGWRGLQRVGIDPSRSDHPIIGRVGTRDLNPAELYAVMTHAFEAASFPVKGRLLRDLDRLGDADLSTFLRYDRGDETIHVGYGHKWVPRLAERFGVPGDLKEIVESSSARFWAAVAEARSEPPVRGSLADSERISYNSLARQYGVPTLEADLRPGRWIEQVGAPKAS